jgi:acylphosphatase
MEVGDSLEPNCKRIIIEGYTSFGIQGVNLREEIERRIRHPDEGDPLDVVGMVRNLKDGRVEVICKGNNVGLLYQSIRDWDDSKKFEIKRHNMKPHYDPEATNFTDFIVERSDDLSEMVLALRGAGYRFVQSTKTLEVINKNILDRDKKVELGRLLTLHYEVIRNMNALDEESLQRMKMIRLEVLEYNLNSPVIPNQQFVHLLMEIFYELGALEESENFSAERLDDLRRNLVSMQQLIGNELRDKHDVAI